MNLVLPQPQVSNTHIILVLTFVFICLLVNVHYWLLEKILEDSKSLSFVIMFYLMFLLYFVIILVCLFVIIYLNDFNQSSINLDNYSNIQNLESMNTNMLNLVTSEDISNLLSNTQSQLILYKDYIMNSSVYSPLQNLLQQNQIVSAYYNDLNVTFVQNMQQIYSGLVGIMQSISDMINAYNANVTVLDRLNYLVFDYADYYKRNILSMVVKPNVFNNTIFNINEQLVFNDLFISYESKNVFVYDNNNNLVFSFNNNNNSSFFVYLSDGILVSNLQYTAAVAFDGDQLYLYISQSPGINTDGFQSNISNTIGYSGLFVSASANDISSIYFNSNISGDVNLPVNMFYNNLYNGIIYENIGIPMKFEYVKYNEYSPILVAYNGTQPQWIIQNEVGIPLCVINQVNGEFVIHFAVSDSASVMVNSSSQSVVPMGIDASIWNLI